MSSRDLQTNFPRKFLGKSVDYEAIKRQAYLDQGIAIIDLADSRIAWSDRAIIESACQRLYGQKR